MRNKTHPSLVSLTITVTLAAAALRASPQDLPSASIPPVIRQMIEQARQELARGNPAAAADLFERAAEHGEYPEAEVGEVRARLWAGQFRHAVAISNVVAGEHPESAEAQALLGYIEDRDGYTAQALQRLRNERQSRPQEAAPVAAEAEVLVDRHSPRDAIELIDQWVRAHGVQPDLCRLRSRAVLVENFETGAPPRPGNPCEVPIAHSSAAAGESRWPEATTSKFPAGLGYPLTAGNGFITDGGRRVTTLRRLIDSPSVSIWVRNARGELRRARLEQHDGHTSQIATLSLSAPFAADQSLPQDGFAPGNAHGLCFVLGFPAAMSTDAMLPVVTPCFAMDLHAVDGTLNINIPLSAGERGSPVFDAEGRLVGLADPAAAAGRVGTATPAERPKALTTVIRTTTGDDSPQGTAANHSQATIAMPELYERLAPTIVQVVTFPSTASVTGGRQ